MVCDKGMLAYLEGSVLPSIVGPLRREWQVGQEHLSFDGCD